MDDPDLDAERHAEALDALARINRVSGTTGRILREVVRLARRRRGPVRVLDVACGDGRVLAEVVRGAARRGVKVSAHGCDVSPVALGLADRRLSAWDPAAELFRVDVTRDPLPARYDLVTSSLFLHHLSDDEAIRLLAAMRRAGEVLLVQDLRRTGLGFLLAWTGVRLLSRSDVARVDGPRSVRAAYTLDEARDLAGRAGMPDADVSASWPQRFTLRWEAT